MSHGHQIIKIGSFLSKYVLLEDWLLSFKVCVIGVQRPVGFDSAFLPLAAMLDQVFVAMSTPGVGPCCSVLVT